jgi:hypothetical protein
MFVVTRKWFFGEKIIQLHEKHRRVEKDDEVKNPKEARSSRERRSLRTRRKPWDAPASRSVKLDVGSVRGDGNRNGFHNEC